MKDFTAHGWKSILPEGWADRSMITLVGATGASGIASNIVVVKEETGAPVDIGEYARLQKQAMIEQTQNFELLDEREIKLNGLPAFQRLQRFSVENVTIQQAQTIIFNDSMIYVITGTAAIEDFNGIISAIREFTENFQLTNS